MFEIVLVTYNHPKLIEYILGEYQNYFASLDFVLSVHDSSENDDTKAIVQSNKYYGTKLRYYRYDSSVCVDKKTLLALKNSTGDYVMLAGDGWVVRIDNMLHLIKGLDRQYEIVTVYNLAIDEYAHFYNKYVRADCGEDDICKYLRQNYWYLALYGGSVVRRELIGRIDVDEMVQKYNGKGFIYPSTLAEYAHGPLYTAGIVSMNPNIYKKAAGWFLNHQAMKTWTKNFYESVYLISDGVLGEGDKQFIVSTANRHTGFLTFSNLLRWKTHDNFDYSLYREYKFYFNKMRACNRLQLFVALIIPKALLKLIRRAKRAIFNNGEEQ